MSEPKQNKTKQKSQITVSNEGNKQGDVKDSSWEGEPDWKREIGAKVLWHWDRKDIAYSKNNKETSVSVRVRHCGIW